MGEIITFYSYKGGTGRTMALANTAVLLAREAQGEVLMIDWDLEAPGLEQYFKDFISQNNIQKGLIDFVENAMNLPSMEFGKEDEGMLYSFFDSEIDRLLIPISLPGNGSKLFLIKAGLINDDYPQRISRINWSNLYDNIPGFFPLFAKYLSARFDTVLIDSRTGHTDVGGICTMSMPEKLVLVFTPNAQSLDGAIQLAHAAAKYRILYDNEMRPLTIYPLPSRVDFSGVSNSKRSFWQSTYQMKWQKAFQDIYDLPATANLNSYFEKVYIKHDPNLAFGEDVAVLAEQDNPESVAYDFKRFVATLSFDEIWENEPFSSVLSPYKVSFVFAAEDKDHVDRFIRNIKPLSLTKVIQYSINKLLPVEKWEAPLERKIASGAFDLTVVFLSQNLTKINIPKKAPWQTIIKDAIENQQKNGFGRVIPILLEKTDSNGLFEDLTMLPSRNKAIEKWADPDEAWQRVSELFKREIIKLTEKQHHATPA